jgi:hypothetical protein
LPRKNLIISDKVYILIQINYPCFLCVLLGADFAAEVAFTFGAAGFSAFGAAFLASFLTYFFCRLTF